MTNLSGTVLFTVGTDHHKFDRLIGWAETWAEANRGSIDVVVQHGSSRAPCGVTTYEYIGQSELTHLVTNARVVVTHGGPGTITECWRVGVAPIVVPRLSRLGEHVDDHQERFAKWIAKMGYAEVPTSYDELNDLLAQRISADSTWTPAVDLNRPAVTTEAIASLVEELVANRAHKRRRVFGSRQNC